MKTECINKDGKCVKKSILKDLSEGYDIDDYFELKDVALKKTHCTNESCLLAAFLKKHP